MGRAGREMDGSAGDRGVEAGALADRACGDDAGARQRMLHARRTDAQIAPKRFSRVKKAVDTAPLLALSSNLVDDARAQGGVCTHY